MIFNLIYILFSSLIIFLSFDFIKKNWRYSKCEPPSAGIALPIIGHLLKFGDNPHRSLTELAKEKGGIYSIQMGDHRAMVITDPSIVREIWVKQFSTFSDRPHPKSYRFYSGNFNDLAFADFELWEKNHKLVSTAFTKTKVKSFGVIIEKQTNYLIDSMRSIYNDNKLFYSKKYFSKLAINVVCGMMFSREISPSESVDKGAMAKLTVPIQAVFTKLSANNVDDFVSITSPLFYFENKKFKKQVDEIYEFMEEIYDQHILELNKDNPKDLMDQLIISTNGNQKDTVIHVSMDFLLAGSDSNAAVCEWFCLFLINNPHIQQKAYSELIEAVGKDCKFVSLKEKELNTCPMIMAIIKEILRIRPVGPLGIPRIALKDTTVNNYFIPKGTQVIQNIYGLGQLYVSNPDKFLPERWIEYKNQKEKVNECNYFDNLDKVCIPFGVGQRRCPGQSLSELLLFSVCSNILLNFELKTACGVGYDETEVFGLTIHPKPFAISLVPRF